MMQAPCREPADVDVEGAFHQWLRGAVVASRILPTICVQVQRVLRRAPVGQVQLGERHGFVTTNATLSR